MNLDATFGTVKLYAVAIACSANWGCSASADSAEKVADTGHQPLCAAEAKHFASRSYATLGAPPAGIAGGRTVVIVGSPLEGRVIALDRRTRREVGSLPPPPGGFVLPYIIRALDESHVAVLDAGGFPSPMPFVPANPRIYEYEYDYDFIRGLTAKLKRTISFENELIGFAEDIAPIGHGRYVLSDAALGALWVVESDGKVRPGVAPKGLAPEDALFPLALCSSMPEIFVSGLPFLFSGSALPGVAALAANNGQLYFYSPCGRGLYSIPLPSLFDARQPYERIVDVKLVSKAADTVAVEQLLGLSFSPDSKDHHLYAADSLQLRIIRIDLVNGTREIIADEPTLFDFPSSTAFLPQPGAAPILLVASNQQERTTLTNDAIQQDQLKPPFTIGEVLLRP